jgi:hypothetical protein
MFRQAGTGAPPLDRLASAVSEVAAEDVHGLSGDALGESLIELFRLSAALQAEAVRRVRVFDARRDYSASGALSTAAWLRRACHLTPGQASEQVRLGRQLPSLPEAERAFGEAASTCSTPRC